MKDATDACLKLGSDCSGVYDGQCNNAGAFKLCKAGTAFVGSASSCVYTPKTVGTKPIKPAVTTGKSTSDWTKEDKKHCAGNTHSGKSYSTLKQAQTTCAGLGSACTGVFDSGCNNVGKYYLCKSGKPFLASSMSCVYVRTTGNGAKTTKTPTVTGVCLESDYVVQQYRLTCTHRMHTPSRIAMGLNSTSIIRTRQQAGAPTRRNLRAESRAQV